MAKKTRPIHTCSECGYVSPKWLGRCPDCGAWGTLEEKAPVVAVPGASASKGVAPSSPAQPITKIGAQATKTVRTGIGELDRVLGSGIVPGSVVLMAGEPGVGKSTLLLEVASRWAQLGRTVLRDGRGIRRPGPLPRRAHRRLAGNFVFGGRVQLGWGLRARR